MRPSLSRTSKSIRILVLNNYPLGDVWQEVRRGDKPDHHLFGINHLENMGYDVKVIEPGPSNVIAALARALRRARNPIPLGALDRQWAAWRALREGDVIFAPCGDELNALAYLRAAGLLKTPLLCIQHHTLNRGRLMSLRNPFINTLVRGVDAFPALSEKVAAEINQRWRNPEHKSISLAWGPDASFYPRSEAGHGVLAAGRTGRDFATFGLAASRVGSPARIYCLDTARTSNFANFAPNVQVHTPGPGRAFSYPEMMQAHQNAQVIGIPLATSEDSLAGLTSLVDALALGKPVIMTRNPFIDLDIEAQGIGRWVAPGDVDGWEAAIRWFQQNPDEGLAMGRRARALVDDQGYNSRAFATQIEGLIQRMSPLFVG